MPSGGRLIAVLVLLALGACGTIEVRKSTSTLDYLYPKGAPAIPAQDVALQVPVRVALAFAPGEAQSGTSGQGFGLQVMGGMRHDPLTEVERTALLERIATDMRTHDFVKGVDVIPSSYLTPGGGFDNLDQIAHAFGSDVAVLLSYDQAQFNNTTGWSITYWTVVGAYVVKGEENQTQTFLDAAVLDIKSRALLFRAAGTATSGSESTPIEATQVLQSESVAGFNAAAEDLITQLNLALQEFGKQAAQGTVRGQGTPALAVSASEEYTGVAKFENGRYTGALGAESLLAAALLLLGAAGARRVARGRG